MSVIIQGPVSGLSDADQAYIDLAQATVPDASKLVDSDNLGTAALAATSDFDAAGAAAAAVSGHESTYDHDNIPGVDEAAALTAYQSALGLAEAGQVLTASGPGAAAFAEAAGGPSLSDYSNVIVVDAGGNGDYTTLAAACAAGNAGKSVLVVSDTIETGDVTVSSQMNIFIWPNATVHLGAGNSIYGADQYSIRGGRVLADSPAAIQRGGGQPNNLTLEYTLIQNVAADGVGVPLTNADITITCRYSTIIADIALQVTAIPSVALFEHSTIQGAQFALFLGLAWNSAPFYLCKIKGPILGTFAAITGTAKGSNWSFT